MKKVKEAGDKVLDEETAYIIYKNVPLDLAISSRLEEIEAFKEEIFKNGLMKVIMNLYKRKDGI